MSINTYNEALKYLDSFIKPVVFAKITPEQARKRDPLDRMRRLLELLGNPQDTFPSILVGGTSGKGSTAYLIAHMLTTAGYKTGFTLSPHLEKINERIQIGKNQELRIRNQEKRRLNAIDDEEFVDLLNTTIPAIQNMQRLPVGEPSHFEILIAMAFLYFVQQKVDIAVVEVGLGGRWDATNTLHSLIYVLTNISLDHTAILGDTVEKIAREKVEIIKKNDELRIMNNGEKITVITGVKQASVVEIVEKKCREVDVQLYKLNKDFRFNIVKQGEEATIFDFISSEHKNESFFGMRLSLLGDFQIENASIAIQTIIQLRKSWFNVSESQIRKALSTAFFPGRFEVFEYKIQNTKYQILLDGAHNPEKMRVFIQSVQKLYQNKKKIFLIAFKEDKNIDSMLDYIIDAADVIIATEFSSEVYVSNQHALDAHKIKNQISKMKNTKKTLKIIVEKDLKKAVQKALEILSLRFAQGQDDRENNIAIITGSLYLVGEVRSLLSKRVKPAEAKRFSRAHRA